jgi:peptide/nickel transport system substrate-binding protein
MRVFGTRPRLLGVFVTAVLCALGIFVVSGASASSKKSNAHTVDTNGKITIGTLLGPDSLDPTGGVSGTDQWWDAFLYAKLINFNSQTDVLEPGLASAWHWVGPKKLELVLTLRHGVTFQDGTPFNAAAVVYNFKRYMKKGDIADDLQYATGFKATGPYTVAIKLSQPNSQLIDGLSDRAGMMISPTADQKEGANFAANPVGAGPYKFVSEVPNESYTFQAWSGYYLNSQSPRVQNVTVQVFQTATAMATAEQTGNIQVATQIPTSVLKPLQADSKLNVNIAPGSTPVIVWFDGALKPLNDPRMRLAFNLALNRVAIMKAITGGLGSPITELEPRNTPGYVKSADPLWPVKGNPAKARQLVKEAGYPHGVSFTCYNYPGIGYDITDPIIESEEAAVGIHVKVLDGSPSISAAFFKGKSGPCMMSGYATPPDTIQIALSMLYSKSFYDAQGANFGVDQYLAKISTTYTNAGLQSLFKKINQVEKTNPGAAPMYTGPVINVYDKNIKGWDASPILQDNWQGMYFTS